MWYSCACGSRVRVCGSRVRLRGRQWRVCVPQLTVMFRTWDTSTQYFHANATFYAAVLSGVPPHPRLVISIKHTMLDFWRRVRPNPTLGVGAHLQVVEAEVGGMYGGCGTWPLYVGDGVINHYEEDVEFGWARGLTWLRNSTAVLGGVLTNHQCTSEIGVPAPWVWWRLEQEVLARWTQTPDVEEAVLFDRAVESQWGLTDVGVRAAVRNLTLSAMSANLRMQTCAAHDVTLGEVDRPLPTGCCGTAGVGWNNWPTTPATRTTPPTVRCTRGWSTTPW